MAFLSGLFGGGKKNNPANAAMPYLNQIGPMAQQNYAPAIQQGQAAANQNTGEYSKMVSDPSGFLESLRASYTPSEGYKFKQDKYSRAAEGVAAARGFRGTAADEAARADLVRGLLAEDEGAYLDRLTGILGAGLQGNELTANRGFNATGDLTNILGSTLGAQGTLAYKGQESQNATRQGFAKMLSQLLGGAAGAFMGGPMGAITGANVAGGNLPYPNAAPQSNQKQFGMGLPWLGGNF